MDHPDIIVVGASAGGVAALQQFVQSLPGDFQGSVFIVLHIPPYAKSRLPNVLSSSGPLKAVHPKDGDEIKPGVIYVAPNDFHLLIDPGKILVKKGPKENRFRPSVDALFRSAAVAYGPRVIGIILSGVLNDGASGMWSVKAKGGITVIQSPEDAQHFEMPKSVMEFVDVDYVLPASGMGQLIMNLQQQPAKEPVAVSEAEIKRLEMEVVIAKQDNAFEMGIIKMGELTVFTCPECHGALARIVEGKIIRFRCHTGHAYTSSSLLASITESVEVLLWQGMRSMEEATLLLNSIAEHFDRSGDAAAAGLFRGKADINARSAQIIHDSIFKLEQYSEDLRFEDQEATGKK
jgi:two-component system chemotaxis response regulator CheB